METPTTVESINDLIEDLQNLNELDPKRENSLAITHLEIARNFLLQRDRQ